MAYCVTAGGLTILTAALDQEKCAAKYAFSVLHQLMDKRTLPAEQADANEALLARMQGLRRCSTLLLYEDGQGSQAGFGMLSTLLCLTLSLLIRNAVQNDIHLPTVLDSKLFNSCCTSLVPGLAFC